MATTTRFWKRKLITAKIETTGGTDAAPTVGLNAIEARNVQFTPLDAQYVENNVEAGYFGNAPEVPVSQAAKLSFDVAIQGSGAAGTAPAFGALLRGCAIAETNLAAAAAGTCQAGSTANTIKLAGTASAVDNAYRGMRIRTTGGTGTGQVGYILAYNGTTKVATMFGNWTTTPDATTTYSIDPQTVYGMVSSAIESLTIYVYMDGLLHKMIYARGSCSLKLSPKNLPMMSFEFVSMYTTPTDLPLPSGAVLSGFKAPLPVLNSYSSGFELLSFQGNMYDLSINIGQKVIHRDDCIGIDDTQITDRSPGGAVSVQAMLQAEKDFYTAARDGTLGNLLFTHGTLAGSRMRLAAPACQVKSPKLGERDGINKMDMDTRFVPVNGNDELFMIFD